MAILALAEEEYGFIPRHLRRAPKEIPEGKKWCWFCEELHDLDYFINKECREYVTYRMAVWKKDPVNRDKQRLYWRRYAFKSRLKDKIEGSGCNVQKIHYLGNDLEIIISPKYIRRYPVKR